VKGSCKYTVPRGRGRREVGERVLNAVFAFPFVPYFGMGAIAFFGGNRKKIYNQQFIRSIGGKIKKSEFFLSVISKVVAFLSVAGDERREGENDGFQPLVLDNPPFSPSQLMQGSFRSQKTQIGKF